MAKKKVEEQKPGEPQQTSTVVEVSPEEQKVVEEAVEQVSEKNAEGFNHTLFVPNK